MKAGSKAGLLRILVVQQVRQKQVEALHHQLREVLRQRHDRVHELEARLQELQHHHAELCAENQRLAQEAKSPDLQPKLKELRRQNEQLDEENRQLREKAKEPELVSLIQELQRRNGHLSEENRQFSRELEGAGEQLASLRALNVRLSEEVQRARQERASSTKGAAAAAQEQLGELQAAESTAKRQVKRWQERAKILARQAQVAEEAKEAAVVLAKELSAKELRARRDRSGLVKQLTFLKWRRRAQGGFESRLKELEGHIRRNCDRQHRLLEVLSFVSWKYQVASETIRDLESAAAVEEAKKQMIAELLEAEVTGSATTAEGSCPCSPLQADRSPVSETSRIDFDGGSTSTVEDEGVQWQVPETLGLNPFEPA